MRRSKQAWLSGLALLLISVVASQFWLSAPQPAAPRDAPVAQRLAEAVSEREVAPPAAPAATPESAGARLQALTRASVPVALFDPQSAWFDAPEMLDDQQFAPGQTRITGDSSCSAQSVPDPTKTLQQQLLDTYQLNAQTPVPEQIEFSQLQQYFQLGRRFYQFSATLSEAPSGGYQLEFFSASDPALHEDLERVALTRPTTEPLDANAVRLLLRDTLAEYRQKGALIGARVLQVRVARQAGVPEHEFEFLNATPVRWQFANGICRLQSDRTSSWFSCVATS